MLADIRATPEELERFETSRRMRSEADAFSPVVRQRDARTIEPHEDWLEVTPEQLALLRSCGPDERCIVYGSSWVKLTTPRLVEIMGQAFKGAYANAAKELGDEDVETFDVDEMDISQTYMRVIIAGVSGRKCAGVGTIPDPRAHSCRTVGDKAEVAGMATTARDRRATRSSDVSRVQSHST